MFLVVGLGNPGKGYSGNRHNIGFMAVDRLVHRYSFGSFKSKFKGKITEGNIGGEKVLLLKPETYMNNSGESVGVAAGFYKIPPENVIVIHDELDIVPGKLKVKKGGGAAGHNGLKSIAAHYNSDFTRIRMGIGHPGAKEQVANYVLKDFAKIDEQWLDIMLDAVADAFPLLLKDGESVFMSRVAELTEPIRPKKKKPAKQKKTSEPEIPEKENSKEENSLKKTVSEKQTGESSSAIMEAFKKALGIK